MLVIWYQPLPATALPAHVAFQAVPDTVVATITRASSRSVARAVRRFDGPVRTLTLQAA